ncbi:MAG: GGDEF domain-containing protein [Eubacteriales bacterium]|nr:GGDEF domain-containing protein [Eubacteriales bacterium]
MSFKENLNNLRVEKVSVGEVPKYYTLALRSFYVLMVAYLGCYVLVSFFLEFPENSRVAIPWLTAFAVLLFFYDSIPIRWTLWCISGLILTWIFVFVVYYGWGCGAQYFNIPLLLILLFSIFTSFGGKVAISFLIPGVQLFLYFFAIGHQAMFFLPQRGVSAFQILNTAFAALSVVVVSLIFSTDIQKSARQLVIYNEELKRQASTDALTGLWNRRHMLEIMEHHIASHPHGCYCVAMGDIDHFKRINDTYGHECGDEVLRRIAELFRSRMSGRKCVCRWGGEEFFFFMPEMNLDEASTIISDLNIAVSQLDIRYKEAICRVTMTFGVEETDYVSSLKDIIKRADEKLYFGKNNGRNQVIF